MDIEELLEMDVMEIIDRHPEKLNELVKNNKFKNKLYRYIEENGISWPMMRGLVSSVGEKEVIDNLDITKMVENSNISHNGESSRCISALLENGNSYLIDKVMQDDRLSSTFFDSKMIDSYSSYLENLESGKRREIFDSIYKKDPEASVLQNLVKNLDEKSQKEIINGDYNSRIIESAMNHSSLEIIQDYIDNNPRALTKYQDLDVLSLAKRGVVFPKDITRQKEFFEKIKSNDMVEFRKNINLISRDTCSFNLMNKVKIYEENILDDFNEEKGIFSKYDFENPEILKQALECDGKDYILDYNVQAYAYEFKDLKNKLENANRSIRESFNLNIDISNLDETTLESIEDERLKNGLIKAKEEYMNSYNQIQNKLKEESAKKFGPMLSDYTFTDTKNDVETNTYELLEYNKKLANEKKLLSKDKVNLYSKFNDLDSMSAKEQYELYKETKDKNMTAELYTDISKAKKEIYKDICDSLYDVNKNIDDISVEDSDKTGMEYHKLDGQPFYMLVRVLDTPYNEKTKNSQSCYTLISSDNINVFRGKYVYYYGKVEPNKIINTFESDSYTNSDTSNTTDRANRLSTKEDLVQTDASYSEINIANEKFYDENGKEYYKEMKPDGLLSFGEPDKDILEENKRINGKMTEINKEKYKQNLRVEDRKQDNRYDYDINANER